MSCCLGLLLFLRGIVMVIVQHYEVALGKYFQLNFIFSFLSTQFSHDLQTSTVQYSHYLYLFIYFCLSAKKKIFSLPPLSCRLIFSH
jgi:hypothetical protein